MEKYYFTITSILVLAIGITSCSNEETKTQNDTASRPTIPIMVNEVQIGNQIWMTKNLNVSRYRNGDPIPQVTDPTQWANLTTGAWCYYNNDPANGPIYGKLYNWYAVKDPRGLAPAGYHVPTYTEWNSLIIFLGDVDVAGGKMKEMGITNWLSPNEGATNSSSFTGLPGGNRSFNGSFDSISYNGCWWSSTEYTINNAWLRLLFNNNTRSSWGSSRKTNGFSVRCIKD